jgi:hypothetical protein
MKAHQLPIHLLKPRTFRWASSRCRALHPLLTSWLVRRLIVRTRDIDERDRPEITSG